MQRVMTTLDGDHDVTENCCVVVDNGQVSDRPVVWLICCHLIKACIKIIVIYSVTWGAQSWVLISF